MRLSLKDSPIRYYILIPNYLVGIGANLVKLIPLTADLYSSTDRIRPNIADNTTTGVDANKDSPYFNISIRYDA